MELDEENSLAYFYGGRIFLDAGENEKALVVLDAAIESTPDHADSYFYRADRS